MREGTRVSVCACVCVWRGTQAVTQENKILLRGEILGM